MLDYVVSTQLLLGTSGSSELRRSGSERLHLLPAAD